ncbi:MAG: hypothetical protein K0S38_116 [Candidatus Paceibacter sp.]|jgi:predicted PurR-regulated permease PerM|nr:hypothetical protein [Candidatus Paceibacter sp.]
MNSATKIQHYFFLILVLIACTIMFFIWRPFLAPLVFAGSLAIVFFPVFDRINAKLGGRNTISALLTVLLILLVVLIPLIIVGGLLFNEARGLYFDIATDSGGVNIINQITDTLQTKLQSIAPDATLNTQQYLQNGLQWILEHLNTFFSSFIAIIFGLVIMFIALFFFLRDGRAFRDKVFVLSPLNQEYDKEIFRKLVTTIDSVIKGSLFVGLIQGAFATIGYFITGVPNPILWGIATMFASFIPGIGTSLVTVPAIIFLFVTQPLWHAVVLAIWAFSGVGLIDNFLTPVILKRGIKVHPFLILISVLGGIAFFGPIGLLMGPIMLAFFFALLDIYPLIIRDQK